jgi:hypothetical protein
MSELDFLRERSQARAEADLARIWGDYIRVIADYLNLVDGMWELR